MSRFIAGCHIDEGQPVWFDHDHKRVIAAQGGTFAGVALETVDEDESVRLAQNVATVRGLIFPEGLPDEPHAGS